MLVLLMRWSKTNEDILRSRPRCNNKLFLPLAPETSSNPFLELGAYLFA